MKKVAFACLVLACCWTASAQVAVGVVPAGSPPSCAAAASPGPTGDRLDHLLKAAGHLEAAGMKEEAVKLRRQIEEEKQALLVRIDALQAEVERLRRLVGGAQQVLVRVKMVEISRSKLRKLGFDFAKAGTGSSNAGYARPSGNQPFEFGIVDNGDATFGLIEALRQDKLARVLAEPTLMTLSGQPATLQVGGEVPAPVTQEDGSEALGRREFGTRVDLLPTVFGNGRIRLAVRARVSEIDPSRTVEVEGQTCPSLNVREVDTAVELNNGQTLILGGLVSKRIVKPVAGGPQKVYAPPADHVAEKAGTEAEEIELLFLVRPEIVASPEQELLGSQPPRPLPGAIPSAFLREVKPTAVPRVIR